VARAPDFPLFDLLSQLAEPAMQQSLDRHSADLHLRSQLPIAAAGQHHPLDHTSLTWIQLLQAFPDGDQPLLHFLPRWSRQLFNLLLMERQRPAELPMLQQQGPLPLIDAEALSPLCGTDGCRAG
jgi:hypothetical protein